MAKKRLPRRLQNTIESGAKGILRKSKGGAANSEIQSHIWKTRNKKWIKLEGERKREKSSSGLRQRRMNRRHPQQRIQIQSIQ